MRFSVLALPVFLSFFLAACGGGGDAAPSSSSGAAPQAAGLTWVDVQDGQGRTVMQHRYAAGSAANEEVVTTTQYAGNDGVWGTADDWRTATTRCRFQPGTASSSPVGFGPDIFLGVSASLCTIRRALAGTVQAEIHGTYLAEETLALFRPDTASESMLELVRTMGWQPLLDSGDVIAFMEASDGMEGPMLTSYRIQADAGGVRLCRDDCLPLRLETSLEISCRSLCGVSSAPVSDGIVIDLDPDSCGAALVHVYDGIRAQGMMNGGRLDKVVYSPALDSPYCYVVGYDQYRHDSTGRLTATESYDGAGSDRVWLTADDRRSSYLRLMPLTSGQRQVLYSGAGPDGVWETGDDVIGYTQELQLGAANRLLRATRCTDAGTDLTWQTADDVCQVMVFHYSDER